MKNIKKLFHFLKPYRLYITLSLILLVAVVIMDLSIPHLIQRIIDQGIEKNDNDVVVKTALLMLGISFLDTLAAVGNNIYSIRVGEGVARDIREGLFLKIQSFSYNDLDRFTTGRMMVRLSSDTTAIQRLAQISLRIGTRGPLTMIGSLILMISTDKSLVLSLAPFLLISFLIIIFFSMRMEPMFRFVQQRLDRLNTVLQENVSGARLVKAFVRADYEGQRFDVANQDYTAVSTRVMEFMASITPILTMLVNLCLCLIIWIGGGQVIHGTLTQGQIVAFSNYLLSTMSPLIMLTNLANVWANGAASAERVNEIFDTVPEVREREDASSLPEPFQGQVEFKNVSFCYSGSDGKMVLEDINLVAEPGQTIAILGATGSGKTSLINLIPRFYEVTQGQVLVDGFDVRDITQDSLLAHVAVVPQETILFTGTVRDNIRYGRPEADDDEVIAAAMAAQAHNFILELPNGYDSNVDERGVNLSGGQKQRIAIARALITKPHILILDDSTSSVDVETETQIQDALGQMAGQTRFVVAQRISTVLNADRILVLDRGRIVAQGKHSELVKNSRVYQEIYDSQLGSGPGNGIKLALNEERE